MALSTDINLPKSHHARFPDKCVVCEHENPNSHVRVISGAIGWWTILLTWWGMPFMVKAPACNACAWRLQGRRFVSLTVTVVIGVLVLIFVWPHVKNSVPPAIHLWAFLGVAIVCLLPQIAIEVCFARRFDITVFGKSVTYEFTSKTYAIEFAVINDDAEWIKVNGEELAWLKGKSKR